MNFNRDEGVPGYTPGELVQMIEGMKTASEVFYRMAQSIHFHEFLEFTGFMNEFIKVCERSLAAGEDFTQALSLIRDYEASYVGEKFGCIFKETFAARPEVIAAFCLTAFGVKVVVDDRPGARSEDD